LCHIRTTYPKDSRREGELSRDDLIHLEGVVKKMLGGGTMEVECDQGVKITGVLSGRMKKNKIKVIVGDRVQVSVSPYDTSHGLITYRLK
jgi:translation initiation factor IF-1